MSVRGPCWSATPAGSATGTGNVVINAGTLSSGTGNVGIISGAVLPGTGAMAITPGGGGHVGTLTLGGLTTNASVDDQLRPHHARRQRPT